MAQPRNSNQTAVVTGAAGFVGSHLVDRLLEEGLAVIGLDNFRTGHAGNLSHLADHPRFRLIRLDVSEPFDLDGGIDLVFHLASPASPPQYLRYPVETLMAGAQATHHCLELATRKGATFLLASTSEVYGDPEVHPQAEDYWGHVNPTGPRSCYDEAKRYAEALTMAYHRSRGTDTRIVRIFNTYGPRMRLDDGRVVPTFIRQALRGEPLTVFGDGLQTRSFCHVADLVEGIWRLACSDFVEPVNCGNPDEMTILRFAERIAAIVGVELRLEHRPLPQDDPKVRRPDISRAREVLGWQPVIPFEQGIRDTVDFFQRQPSG